MCTQCTNTLLNQRIILRIHKVYQQENAPLNERNQLNLEEYVTPGLEADGQQILLAHNLVTSSVSCQ